MQFRSATIDDAPAILNIYAQYIDTPITFDYVLPSPDEFRARVAETLAKYPYHVALEGDTIIGYAYAGPFGHRAAYQWGSELSIYLDGAHLRNGLGHALYSRLIDELKIRGYRTVYGCVTTPNPASERLHESLGFKRVGCFENAGFKNGRWHDVIWFAKPLF